MYQNRKQREKLIEAPPIKGTAAKDACAVNKLCLDDGERVILIEGCYEKTCITRFFVQTDRGKYINCGKSEGKRFKWIFKANHYFYGFLACVKHCVTFLLPQFAERPPEIVHKMVQKCEVPNLTKPSNVWEESNVSCRFDP